MRKKSAEVGSAWGLLFFVVFLSRRMEKGMESLDPIAANGSRSLHLFRRFLLNDPLTVAKNTMTRSKNYPKEPFVPL